MARKSVAFALLSLVLAGSVAPALASQDCDSECQGTLREKVIRELHALNEGWVMA